jgi:hypothetical protein
MITLFDVKNYLEKGCTLTHTIAQGATFKMLAIKNIFLISF